MKGCHLPNEIWHQRRCWHLVWEWKCHDTEILKRPSNWPFDTGMPVRSQGSWSERSTRLEICRCSLVSFHSGWPTVSRRCGSKRKKERCLQNKPLVSWLMRFLSHDKRQLRQDKNKKILFKPTLDWRRYQSGWRRIKHWLPGRRSRRNTWWFFSRFVLPQRTLLSKKSTIGFLME